MSVAAGPDAVLVVAGESTTYVLRIAVRARQRALGPLHPGFDINSIIHDGLVKLLPDNAHLMCNGRLHVSLTRVSDGKNVLLSHFDSREDLIQVIMRDIGGVSTALVRPKRYNSAFGSRVRVQ